MKMSHRTLPAALAFLMLAGCGTAQGSELTDAPSENAEAPVVQENDFTAWLPEKTELRMAKTEHLPELAALIGETYGIPESEWADTRYYYDSVDLNEDGAEEIFAVAMGMYTSGTGGDSALLVQPYAGMNAAQRFTLVRTPVLISDHMTNGAHDLIFLRSGGGNAPEYVRLTCTDGIYSNPADAEVLENLDGITGTAILCNDIAADLENGAALTLAGSTGSRGAE